MIIILFYSVPYFLVVSYLVLQAPHEAVGSSARRRRKRVVEKRYRKAKEECTINQCGAFPPEENMNCVFQCISSVCFDAVYGSDPLEDGEIDSNRERIFSKCVKKIEYEQFRQKKA